MYLFGNLYLVDLKPCFEQVKALTEKRDKQFKWSMLALFGPWILSHFLFYMIGFTNELVLFALPMFLGCFVCFFWIRGFEAKEKLKLANLYSNPLLKIN